jgi:glycosyltransferase involved in cell wall biosynthesis
MKLPLVAIALMKRFLPMPKIFFDRSAMSASQFISDGDTARDLKDWDSAASFYSAALKLDPKLADIWVQYGHSLKEGGQLDAAEEAYRQSIRLAPNKADTYLQLGHALKTKGKLHEARTAYEKSLEIDSNDFARTELIALNELNIYGQDVVNTDRPSAWVFDCSDLVQYLRNDRTLTGIQRVQVNIVMAICKLPDCQQRTKIVYFDVMSHSWKEITQIDFQRLVNSAGNMLEVPDSAWAAIREQICGSERGGIFNFGSDDVLINLGTSWWIPDYFLRIKALKLESRVRYVPFVHDCIPVVTPEYCDQRLVRQFLSWIKKAMRYADAILVNSESTAADLKSSASGLNLPVPNIRVIPLNGDIREGSGLRPSTQSHIRTQKLLKEIGVGTLNDERYNFVLMVSTLEIRKNHLLAFRIWQRLIDEYGAQRTPHLICVGKEGWKFSAATDFLQSHPQLAARVILISGIEDDVLAELYKCCSFTFFPSHYEGWGLPVTEALCFSRVPVVSKVSSLPEAGGEFAEYFNPLSLSEAYAAIQRLAFDRSYRSEREAKISSSFKARVWGDVALDVARTLEQLPESSALDTPAAEGWIEQIRPGTVYRFEATGMADGEEPSGSNLRSGSGWNEPEDWGVWTGSTLVELSGLLPERIDGATLYLFVRLKAPPSEDGPFSVTIKINASLAAHTFDARAFREHWLRLVFPIQELRVTIINGKLVNLGAETGGADRRSIGCGIIGFAVALEEDIASRVAIAEQLLAITLPNLIDNGLPALNPVRHPILTSSGGIFLR